MTVTIHLTPQEEAWLNAQTQRQGITPAEVIQKLMDQQMPMEETPMPRAKSSEAIAFLRQKLQEDATTDPEEIRKAEEEFAEIKRNLNANRDATESRGILRRWR